MPARYYPYVTILCLTLFIGAVRFLSIRSSFRLLLLLILFNLICDSFGRWLSYEIGTNNPIFHLQLPFHGILYWIILKKTVNLGIGWNYIFIFSITFSITNSLMFQSLIVFPSYGVIVMALIIVAASLYGFYTLTETTISIPLSKKPEFWFLLGNILFFSVTFFSFGLINFIHSSLPNWIIWTIYTCNIILYLCYLICIWVESKSVHIGK